MSAESTKKPRAAEGTRMTIGEHLDELRGCLIRSLLALFAACIVCIWPAKFLLWILVRPVVLALQANDQPTSLLATNPVENIVVYIKVVVIFGVILAGPYIIYQFWNFIAVGLYKREKAWVYKLVPISIGLFVTGVLFMYVFALVVSLNFLVGFSSWLPLPQPEPNFFERQVMRFGAETQPATQPTAGNWPTLPVLFEDPEEPPPGAVWFNDFEHRFKVCLGDRVYSYQFQRDDRRAMVTTHFKIGEYLSFVMVLTVAFGLAFQLPLVVIFLARSGLVPVEKFRKYRKPAILIIVFIAGMLAPPDLLSHVLLSGPMIVLFEIGLFLAGRQQAAKEAREAE
ncbi:MAG: twin-arginine translocase subunit TatC [Planctomycetota bacterium]